MKKTKSSKSSKAQKIPKNLNIPLKVGRPTDYKPEYCQMVIEHMAKVFSFESFAGVVGVSKQTLYDWRSKHKDFLDAHNVAKMKVQLGIEKMFKAQITGQMKGSPATLIFYAKNITGFKDEPTEEIDYEGLEFTE